MEELQRQRSCSVFAGAGKAEELLSHHANPVVLLFLCSAAVLSSLSLAVIQLNAFQASASLAVRGRFLDARTEAAVQQQLIERAVQHNQSAEDEQTYEEWLRTMEPINKSTHNLIRRSDVISDYESLTDAGAALLINMKHYNRKSILRRGDPRL